MVSEHFKGTQLFKTIILVGSYVFLFLIMFFMIFDVILALWTLPFLFAFMLAMWIGLREETIKILRKYAGMKVGVAPIDQEQDLGEVMEFRIKNIFPLEEFTESQLIMKDLIMEREKQLLERLDKKKDVKDIRFIEIDDDENDTLNLQKVVGLFGEHKGTNE